MHQTVREFLIRTIPDASNVRFDMSEEGANRVITTTFVRYLELFFMSPRMRDFPSKVEEWTRNTYRTYAEYLNEWPLIENALCHIKEIRSRGRLQGSYLQIVTPLIGQLTVDPASSFLGSFMDFRFGENYLSDLSDEIKYSTLNAAGELPELPHAKGLLLTCIEDWVQVEGKTPLMISAQKRLPEATRLLLDRNLDKDAQDNNGRMALHYAAENCDEAIVQLLVDRGANKRMVDNRGSTPYQVAINNMYAHLVRRFRRQLCVTNM
jgi:hypothetical protein